MSSPRLLSLLAVLGLLLLLPLRAELSLSAEYQGAPLDLSSFVATGKPATEHDAVHLSVQGAIEENAALIRWSPNYSIRRIPSPTNGDQSTIVACANVSISLTTQNNAQTGYSPQLTSHEWHTGMEASGIFIAAWILDGKVVATDWYRLDASAMQTQPSFQARFSIPLREDQMRGQGVLLYWTQGRFLKPQPRFEKPAEEEAFLACVTNNPQSLGRALAQRINPNATGTDGIPLVMFAAEAGATECLQLLINAKAKLSEPTIGKETPLVWAASKGRLEAVNVLLKAGAKPNKPSGCVPPLAMAVSDGHLAVVERLLQEKADCNAKELRGLTPLLLAIENNQREIAELLIKNGSSVNGASKAGTTPLGSSVTNNKLPFVQILIKAGAAVDALEAGNNTLVHLAALHDNQALLKCLLDAGAPANRPNAEGFRPLDLYLRRGDAEACALLLKHGAALTLSTQNFPQCLEACLRIDQDDLLQRALDQGLSPNWNFPGNWSLLQVAELLNADRCSKRLIAAGAKHPSNAPVPLAPANALDTPLKPLSLQTIKDTRTQTEACPEIRFTLEFLIDAEGKARFPKTPTTVPHELMESITQTVSSWTFSAPRYQGSPAAVRSAVPISLSAIIPNDAKRIESYEKPVVIHQVPMSYPEEAHRKGIQGEVVICFIINTEGKVENAMVTESTSKLLNQAALDSVIQWTFKPARLGGRAIRCEMKVPIIFNIEESAVIETKGSGLSIGGSLLGN